MFLDEESLAWFLERTAVEKGVPAGRNSKDWCYQTRAESDKRLQ